MHGPTFADLIEVDLGVGDDRGLLVLADGLGAEHGSAAVREDEVHRLVQRDVSADVARLQLALERHDLRKISSC